MMGRGEHRSRFFGFCVFFCLACCVLAVSAPAQIGNASLGGTVSDPSGGVVVGAELTLVNTANRIEAKFTTNDRGEYMFRNLTPGTYELRVSKAGFENYRLTGIVITINDSSRADVVLKVGAPVETVTVESGTSLINYDNGTLQGGADPETLKDLPLVVEGKPRSSAALALLLPGISSGGGDQAFQARINGGQESGDEALLDGATMQEGFMSQSGMVSIHQDFQMSPDMVQEVKVLTSSYDAQYGSSTSGQITMISKGGTSEYHGAAFEYARNAALNSKQWGAPKASHDNEHNFGANVGGPIKIPWLYHGTSKHHSFFYFNWESYHQAGGSNSPTLSIPSVKERGGNFTDWGLPIYAPGNFAPGSNAAQATGPQSTACKNALPAGFGPG